MIADFTVKIKNKLDCLILRLGIKYNIWRGILNVANVNNGDIIKTYKQLCSLLEIKPCGGDSKKAQIKKMNELFSFERQGNAFLIKEIYGEKHNSLSSGYFANGLQKILLTKMINWKTNIITMKFSEWIDWLDIINPNYELC